MKLKFSHLFIVAFITFFTACSTDDESSPTQSLAEETPIAKEKVFDNVIVEGATKKAGEPDTPNEQVTFTLNKKNTSAVMVDGFDVEFNSNDAIVGAYFQIKDIEGNIADGYYDIDLSKVGKKNNSVKNKKSIQSIGQLLKSKQTTQKNSNGEEDIVVDVDFKETIEPGTFCYIVCVYDAAGNISAPQEVCITVQSWGGKDDLAGIWNYSKTEEFEDGETVTIAVGEKSCDTLSLSCSNGSVLKYNECYGLDSFKFTINSDGTYVYELYDVSDRLDYNASTSACDDIMIEETDHYISKGNWAYDQQKEEFIIVEFESTENDEHGVEQTETYDKGEAYVSVLNSAVNGNSLTLTEEYLDANGAVNEYYKYYFDKE